MIGLAEVQYHQSSHLCKRDTIDADGVKAAREQFRSALAAPDQPPLSNVAAKGHFGIGRANYCLSQAAIESAWDDADRELTTVIAEYEAGNKGVQDLAAEAHFLMASVRMPAVGNPDKASFYRAAVEEYRKAIELSLHDARKALFFDAIGWVMERLGETEEARRAYQQAIDLAPDDAAKDFYRNHLEQVGAAGTPAAGSGG